MSPQAERPYLNHQDFFNRVNISKGPILVTVESIVRRMASDWSSSKHERREYMYYTMQWEAQDWLGNSIKHGHEHEGKYVQQTKEIVTVPDPKQPHMTIKRITNHGIEMFTPCYGTLKKHRKYLLASRYLVPIVST